MRECGCFATLGAMRCLAPHFLPITGLHLTHVIVGIVVLIVVGLRYKSGRSDADDMEITGLYWHFVDLVWMFVVPLVYLLNISK